MKNISAKLICFTFSAFLTVMMILTFVLPKDDFSEVEKRYLTSFPQFSMRTLLDGSFTDDIEAFLADHLPGRLKLVNLNAWNDRIMLRQPSKEIYIGKTGRLFERPHEEDREAAYSNLMFIDDLAHTLDVNIDLLLIPSAGYVMQDDLNVLYPSYHDGEIIESIYSACPGSVVPFDVNALLLNDNRRSDLYYSTDHHLTSYGSYMVASHYASTKYLETFDVAEYTKTVIPEFRGSTYSRASFWRHSSEPIEVWHSPCSFEVTMDGIQSDSLFFMDNAQSYDPYTVFLNGNQPLVKISNSDCHNGKKLLVIRDSFSNCLGGFLADSFETVVLVDMRYFKLPVSELYYEYNFTDILIEYSLSNFLSDNNLAWLE